MYERNDNVLDHLLIAAPNPDIDPLDLRARTDQLKDDRNRVPDEQRLLEDGLIEVLQPETWK